MENLENQSTGRLDYQCMDDTLVRKRWDKDENGNYKTKCLNGRNVRSMVSAKKFREQIKDGEIPGIPVFSLDEVSKEVVEIILDIEDLKLQTKVLLFVKDVIEKDTNPFTLEKFGRYTITERLIREIIYYLKNDKYKPIPPQRNIQLSQNQIDLLYKKIFDNPITEISQKIDLFYHIVGKQVWNYYRYPNGVNRVFLPKP